MNKPKEPLDVFRDAAREYEQPQPGCMILFLFAIVGLLMGGYWLVQQLGAWS